MTELFTLGSFIAGAMLAFLALALSRRIASPPKNCSCKNFSHAHNLMEVVTAIPMSIVVAFFLTTNEASLTGFGLVVVLRSINLLLHIRHDQ
jgi:hypothetical protein